MNTGGSGFTGTNIRAGRICPAFLAFYIILTGQLAMDRITGTLCIPYHLRIRSPACDTKGKQSTSNDSQGNQDFYQHGVLLSVLRPQRALFECLYRRHCRAGTGRF